MASIIEKLCEHNPQHLEDRTAPIEVTHNQPFPTVCPQCGKCPTCGQGTFTESFPYGRIPHHSQTWT